MKSKLCKFATIAVSMLYVFGSPVKAQYNYCQNDANHGPSCSSLPVDKIEAIIEAQGDIKNGVLDIGISRSDIGDVQGPEGQDVTFTASFEISGDLFFQPVSSNKAFLNGDMALKESEVNPFIATLISNGIYFQAFHQHFPMTPQIWFVHFRGTGNPIDLAKAVKAALNVTSTPFPQTLPTNPTTPLDPDRLARILHGHASVGEDGVVTVWVYRKNNVYINGIKVNPQTNISTNIEFKPIGGSDANVVPDFSMTAKEVNPVVNLMRNKYDWYQGCLYNQETDETPQLYFDHMLKTGDAYELAREIRKGLDLTDTE